MCKNINSRLFSKHYQIYELLRRTNIQKKVEKFKQQLWKMITRKVGKQLVQRQSGQTSQIVMKRIDKKDEISKKVCQDDLDILKMMKNGQFFGLQSRSKISGKQNEKGTEETDTYDFECDQQILRRMEEKIIQSFQSKSNGQFKKKKKQMKGNENKIYQQKQIKTESVQESVSEQQRSSIEQMNQEFSRRWEMEEYSHEEGSLTLSDYEFLEKNRI